MCLAIIVSLSVQAFAAEYSKMDGFYIAVNVDSRETQFIRAYDATYTGNLFVSMRDLSYVLSGTAKQFYFAYGYTDDDGEYFTVTTGAPTGETSLGTFAATGDELYLELKRNRLFQDGSERKYYTYRDGYDLFMGITDVCLMLDLDADYHGTHELTISTTGSFSPDIDELNRSEYFSFLSAALVGDATDGEIFFSKYKNSIVPIASTTKLMTYLVIAEAESAGIISWNDYVYISQNADELSHSADGIIKMAEGQYVPIAELMDALLIASSNEAAVALAEHVYGSEEAFTDVMNNRAIELGMGTARFYNPNGLPEYTGDEILTKVQNRMSVRDLFVLVSYILSNYPEITNYTSKLYANMPTLDYTASNSNSLVFNMAGEVTGLKTGSTNKAGYCLVASMPVTVNGRVHNVVSIVLGAESPSERDRTSAILLKYGRECIS